MTRRTEGVQRPRWNIRGTLLLASTIVSIACTWCGPSSAEPLSGSGEEPTPWSEQFAREVDRRLEVPPDDRQRYIALLRQALLQAAIAVPEAQAFVLVDRSAQVQAVFVIMLAPDGKWEWIGASPASTGKVGAFDHFLTPLGVFAHTLANPDFRAEGTFNENHIRGYGLRGRRVFDFGWAQAERGWGAGGTSQMRLQMHATDPSALEPRLGRVESKGCIRIPATLNVFLDRHGILDADYEEAQAAGKSLWVLGADRQTIPWPGRYLVIVDSQTAERPAWSPLPGTTSGAGTARERPTHSILPSETRNASSFAS